MPYVKTAISIHETLFQDAEQIARKLKMPRSRLFSVAMEEFVQQYRNQQLLKQINQAYAGGLDPDEKKSLASMKLHQHRLSEGEW